MNLVGDCGNRYATDDGYFINGAFADTFTVGNYGYPLPGGGNTASFVT